MSKSKEELAKEQANTHREFKEDKTPKRFSADLLYLVLKSVLTSFVFFSLLFYSLYGLVSVNLSLYVSSYTVVPDSFSYVQ